MQPFAAYNANCFLVIEKEKRLLRLPSPKKAVNTKTDVDTDGSSPCSVEHYWESPDTDCIHRFSIAALSFAVTKTNGNTSARGEALFGTRSPIACDLKLNKTDTIMERQPCKSSTVENTSEIQTPDIFLCPISRELMSDPVVVVESGQVYDNVSIQRWFNAGNNTCPLTGVSLASQKVTRLPKLRSCINEWAEKHEMAIEPKNVLEPKQKEFGELDDPKESLTFITEKGVSVYDPKAVVKLITREPVRETYAALVVLRELIRHADEKQFKQIIGLVDIGLLKYLLNEDDLKKPAARLLVSLKGPLDRDEMAALLPIPDIDLQIELMTRLVVEICQRQSSTNRRRFPGIGLLSFLGRLRRCCPFPRRCAYIQ